MDKVLREKIARELLGMDVRYDEDGDLQWKPRDTSYWYWMPEPFSYSWLWKVETALMERGWEWLPPAPDLPWCMAKGARGYTGWHLDREDAVSAAAEVEVSEK